MTNVLDRVLQNLLSNIETLEDQITLLRLSHQNTKKKFSRKKKNYIAQIKERENAINTRDREIEKLKESLIHANQVHRDELDNNEFIVGTIIHASDRKKFENKFIFLMCDGSNYDPKRYPDLAIAIGNFYQNHLAEYILPNLKPTTSSTPWSAMYYIVAAKK